MRKKDIITKILVPILCAVIGAAGGSIATSHYLKNEISIQISNVIDSSSGAPTSNTNVNVSDLLSAYENIAQENVSNSEEISTLKDENRELQKDLQNLQGEHEQSLDTLNSLEIYNSELLVENEKLKAFLLKDNTYANDVDDLVVVKQTSKHLSDLYVIDSERYSTVEMLEDSYGNTHSVSYGFDARNLAWVEYKLNGEYDIFNARIVTTKSTGRNAKLSVEIYVDDSLAARADNITRENAYYDLGPVVISGGSKLTVKVAMLEGYKGEGICFITDDSLSIVN